MIFNPVSSQTIQQNQIIDTRLNAQEGEQSSCYNTAFKVLGIAALLIASIVALAIAGPVLGVVAVVVIVLLPLALIFNACCGGSSAHQSNGNIPWHQRGFTWIPRRAPLVGAPGGRHVGVGDGHLSGGPRRVGGRHVGVGDGHLRGGPGRVGGHHVRVGDGRLPRDNR